MDTVNIFIAFIAGFLTFLSPCVFPIIPGFLSYLAGTSIKDNSSKARIKNLITAIFFILGAGLVFSTLGILISLIPLKTAAIKKTISIIGGLFIILFGLFTLGTFKIPFLERDIKLNFNFQKYRYLGAFLFGATFAAGWSPCIGPILGSILTIALTKQAIAFVLMLSFSIGLGVPFLITGFFAHEAINLIKKSGTFMKYFNIIVGLLLIILGILVITGDIASIANFSYSFNVLK